MSANAKGTTLKVGVFVFVGIVLSTIAVFTIGDSRRVWDRKVTFHASYDDVVGLRPGSVVRMGGIDIGSVSSVEHGTKADDNKVYVAFDISRDEAVRVRASTVASIEGKGLLGDKMVQFTYDKNLAESLTKEGKDPFAPIRPDGWITTASPADPFGDVQKAAQEAKLALIELRHATEGIADEKFKDDLHGTLSSLRLILDGVATGDGAAHRLVFDPDESKKVDHILGNLEVTSANLARVSSDAQEMANQVKSGNGLAHAVLYDDQLAQGMSGSMVELYKALQAVRTGNGLAHSIVYGDDQTQHLMGNVNAMSSDLREIVANVKAGRGTVGALLVDPTVYEDIKALVGNVERNQVLRALVRYSIKQNEDRPHAELKGEPAAAVSVEADRKAGTAKAGPTP